MLTSSKTRKKKLVKHKSQISYKWSPELGTNEDTQTTKVKNELTQTQVLRKKLKFVECVECSTTIDWRIRLRSCGHVFCVKCAINWLQHCILIVHKARIGCQKQGCTRRIHPNDIDALLEPKNTQLDDYMIPEMRLELQRKHELTTVGYALGNYTTSVRCPECKMLYMKETGCNYVQCAFQSCSTWFCSNCCQAVKSVTHFGKFGKCKLGPTDLYRASYILRMFFETNVLGVALLTPAIIYSSLVIFPIAVFVTFVYKCTQKLTSCCAPAVSILMKPVVALPLSIIALFLALCSLPVGCLFACIYILFLVFRFLPIGAAINLALKLAPVIAKFFGVDSIENFIADAQGATLLLEIETYQDGREQSEIVNEEDMTKSQAIESRVRKEDHQARYARSVTRALRNPRIKKACELNFS